MQTVSRYIYVGASCYSFTDEKTGRPVQGAKLFLVPTEMAKKENVTGYAVDVVNAEYGLFAQCRALQPMKVYDFNMDVDLSGKTPRVRVLGILGEAQKEQQKAS
ncbi:hypothetical protein [Cardiobacterium hominis]|uniref:hypothetical protein n=1 Tax=Cardiobacterium hominis TaxID=2718 RepID=UPI0024932227|nr:hypothetical protein [Cardiobacterium hominis]